ncbi:conserved hypothetical protein [Leishmania major strain Friedlin]|uniref:Uncharacterized protein n=1 Tax=Leishmania major TaxID=5664 RepID=Q4Q3X9_LEIMA|nr:conserved hypothetical protein [Leishmania major strain Friedlin]CAG9580798.1 hypothetical_protein_-_conserved [Leishmania major strain Friedlin]CAJ06547.1 conserved hypothetical protein [Leishmania major strain Friedlin]|eukprot:XP_001685969.1 conserved hypothetical protein [Leishmania major strain Friedlin]
MSFVCRGLPRSERLLPLESTEVLGSTDSFLLHVLHRRHDGDGDAGDAPWHSKRLREHVSLYWDQQHTYHSYHRTLLHAVRSTRGPVRFAGFPQVRTAPKRTGVASRAAPAPEFDWAECTGARASANGSAFPPSQLGAEAATAASSSPPQSAEGVLPPPRSLAAWNWISLVAPYERLLCPSLLYSALLSPSVGGCTSLYYATQQPLPAPEATATPAPTGCVRARWSTHTCQSLWTLHSFAAEASIPAQEVYVMCAGTIMYLDVIVTAGRVWSELEGLWGNDLIVELEREHATMQTGCPENSETETRLQLSSLKSFLSQPPQTYADMLQHVRVLLEALARTTTAAASSNEPAAPEAASTALPRPLAPWLEAAMGREVWTSAPDTWTAGSDSSGGNASSVAVQTLRHVVAEWLSRRGVTVTATTPTGSRAVPLPARDLCLSRGSNRGVSASPKSVMLSDCYSARAGSPAPRAGTRRQPMTTARSTGAATAAVSITFEPFEPHDTPRDQHPFFLPPLPQDPAFIAFAVVWRRTLRRCVLEPDMLRQRLRQVILGYTGQRCEELLREARQQQLQRQQSVDSFTVAGPCEGPLSTRASTDQADVIGKNSAAADSALGDAMLTSLPSLPAAAAPPSLLLLTCDPIATSFHVLGPRCGEWLTSSRGGGGWSGFRGELFRCVGPPPPPLTVAPLLSGTRAAQACRRLLPSSGTASSAVASAPSAEQLTEIFVDGALELDSAGGVSSASSAAPGSRVPPLLYSAEELADRLCRLGSALPRYATEVCGDRLRPADADFVREVLQRHCLPLLLACQRRGIQQWGLRGWMKGIDLTLLDNSGAESRVITPAKLVELGLQQARSAGGQKAFATATTLRMVMDGGLSEALAFLEHVQKRPQRTVRRLPVRRLVGASGSIGSGAAPPPAPVLDYTVAVVEALLLRRAEESALFRIFQSHPSAPLLAGCGVQRLALPPHATAPERRRGGGGGYLLPPGSSMLLLVRTCGVAVDWDLQDCYERPRLSRLREPRRLVSHPPRDGASSGGTQRLPLPPELANAVERVTLQHMRGMLQYYLRSLDATAAPCAAGRTAGDTPLASGVKRSRTDSESERVERLYEPLPNTGVGPAERIAGTESSAVVSQADTGGASVADMPRTTLFPIDRAAVLYVLRHHPQYYRQVKGCGIKEVYVAAATLPPAESAVVVARANMAPDRTDALVAAAATSASRFSSATLGPRRAAVIVERVCGQSVEVDVEACYDKVREGRPLRPFVMLA